MNIICNRFVTCYFFGTITVARCKHFISLCTSKPFSLGHQRQCIKEVVGHGRPGQRQSSLWYYSSEINLDRIADVRVKMSPALSRSLDEPNCHSSLHTGLCKIWGFHGGDYEEWRLLGYKNPVRTSQETHYVSTTESSQLMLCKIWGFHGVDCEECRLLGYKNPVCTSQETPYVSTTESSQLMLCKIWGFHGGDYEEWRLLGYKNPVRTSQEILYVSTTESSLLMLCKIWGFTAVTMKNGVFWVIKPCSYFTGDTLRLRYRVRSVNAM
jgi:hypothetical protein